MEQVVECKNLTHYYGDRCIYENLNFSIPEGRILGLLGKNGTGKTTTINILNGFLKPREGVCTIWGESSAALSPKTRARIGLLIEGHVQYSFMTIKQIERFYSQFYPKWKKSIFYELVSLLKIDPGQRISQMSCGQRSQVALGLILAQDADLLILDDFSMGLDPGYRKLFVDFLNEYVKSSRKTVFVTSHIIQDMERFIDDCMILGFGEITLQMSVKELLDTFSRYRIPCSNMGALKQIEGIYHPNIIKENAEIYSFLTKEQMINALKRHDISTETLKKEKLTLEEAFIGITGKY
jgi:ABC-2 type transport system ATP-binding protein